MQKLKEFFTTLPGKATAVLGLILVVVFVWKKSNHKRR